MSECNKNISCDECMKNAPYHWCCELECRQHEFCKECEWWIDHLKGGDKNNE